MLQKIPLSGKEATFAKGFPGQVARFFSNNDEVIIRWIKHPSRKLYPAADCLKASGFKISPLPHRVDSRGLLWGCSTATKNNTKLKVCERIYDESGNNWSDVSSWFWAAILNKTEGPWWSVTTASRIAISDHAVF